MDYLTLKLSDKEYKKDQLYHRDHSWWDDHYIAISRHVVGLLEKGLHLLELLALANGNVDNLFYKKGMVRNTKGTKAASCTSAIAVSATIVTKQSLITQLTLKKWVYILKYFCKYG